MLFRSEAGEDLDPGCDEEDCEGLEGEEGGREGRTDSEDEVDRVAPGSGEAVRVEFEVGPPAEDPWSAGRLGGARERRGREDLERLWRSRGGTRSLCGSPSRFGDPSLQRGYRERRWRW